MNTETYIKLKARRREIEKRLSNTKDEELKQELTKINNQLKQDPPTLEQVYVSILDGPPLSD